VTLDEKVGLRQVPVVVVVLVAVAEVAQRVAEVRVVVLLVFG
jgi:hypothetical protein